MNIIGSNHERTEWGFILIGFGLLICSLCIIIIVVSIIDWIGGNNEGKELLTSWGYTYNSLIVGIILIGIGAIVETKKM